MKGSHAAALRARGQSLGATAHIGKAGVTPQVVDEVKAQLRNAPLLKVRFAPSMDDRKQRETAAAQLAAACGADLVEVRGRTALLSRRAEAKGKG